MGEILKEWGGLAGAAMAIITLLLTVVRPLRKYIKKSKDAETARAEQMTRIERHQMENYLGLLRLQMYSGTLPLAERVNAGDKYLELGGNGAAKVQL